MVCHISSEYPYGPIHAFACLVSGLWSPNHPSRSGTQPGWFHWGRNEYRNQKRGIRRSGLQCIREHADCRPHKYGITNAWTRRRTDGGHVRHFGAGHFPHLDVEQYCLDFGQHDLDVREQIKHDKPLEWFLDGRPHFNNPWEFRRRDHRLRHLQGQFHHARQC